MNHETYTVLPSIFIDELKKEEVKFFCTKTFGIKIALREG